jgi:endogenous inhibitor of DNA gyrase (YacG/DUF329 family)
MGHWDRPGEECPNCGRQEVRRGEGWNSGAHKFEKGWVLSLHGAEDNEVIAFCPYCGYRLEASNHVP